jgi:hypothetical protein
VVSVALRGHTPIEVKKTPGGRLSLHGGHDRQGIGWISQQKALIPDKPFFIYFAPGATHAPHHVPNEWATSTRASRQGMGRAPRGNVRSAEAARRDPEGRGAHRAPQGNSRVEGHAGRPQAGASPPDGGVRRVHGVRGPPRRTTVRHAGTASPHGRHPGVLHPGRQRRIGRGHAQRHVQRDDQLQRCGRPRDAQIPDGQARQAGRAGVLQSLRGGLGARHEHAVPVDEAGRVTLGWHAQRHYRALA